uniref:Uncharacterized protein n=1 Tax=Rhizophora mucronata TaxID=61149 RepID=A0A2P2MXM4_RHIMU
METTNKKALVSVSQFTQPKAHAFSSKA